MKKLSAELNDFFDPSKRPRDWVNVDDEYEDYHKVKKGRKSPRGGDAPAVVLSKGKAGTVPLDRYLPEKYTIGKKTSKKELALHDAMPSKTPSTKKSVATGPVKQKKRVSFVAPVSDDYSEELSSFSDDGYTDSQDDMASDDHDFTDESEDDDQDETNSFDGDSDSEMDDSDTQTDNNDIDDASDDSEADNALFDTLASSKAAATQKSTSITVMKEQSLAKNAIIRQQVERVDFASKLRILLQKVVSAVHSLDLTALSSDERHSMVQRLATLQKSIQGLYSSDRAQWIAWIEPWFASTQLSSTLKSNLSTGGASLKVIGGTSSFESMLDFCHRQESLSGKLKMKSGLVGKDPKYDDSDFYQALLKDILATKTSHQDTSAPSEATSASKKLASKKKRDKFFVDTERLYEKIGNFATPLPNRHALEWDDARMDALYASLPKI